MYYCCVFTPTVRCRYVHVAFRETVHPDAQAIQFFFTEGCIRPMSVQHLAKLNTCSPYNAFTAVHSVVVSGGTVHCCTCLAGMIQHMRNQHTKTGTMARAPFSAAIQWYTNKMADVRLMCRPSLPPSMYSSVCCDPWKEGLSYNNDGRCCTTIASCSSADHASWRVHQ